MSKITIELAKPEQYGLVGESVNRLLVELFPQEKNRDVVKDIEAARNLLGNREDVWAFLAWADSGKVVGVITLNECHAIYSLGGFGEISELYVDTDHRSSGVGAMLIDAAKNFALEKGWPELEVGAPPQPKWQKTLDFYISQGFEYSGPRLYLQI